MHDTARPTTEHSREQALFTLSGVGYRYPNDVPALSGIDLAIQRGDRLALVGQNGSGKTTLVKHLAGLLQPEKGEVHFNGEPLRGEHLQTSRLRIGLLFQDPDDQLFGNSLLEDVAFGPRNQGHDQASAEELARHELQQVGLLHYAYKAPHHLSFGQRKRAALAGLLAMQPEVLILDEPTANLDPRQEELLLQRLEQFHGTLVCISHDLVFLYQLCQRAVVLDRGHIHHNFSMQELVSHRPSLREHGLDFSFRFAGSSPNPKPTEVTPARQQPEQVVSASAETPELLALKDYRFSYPDGTQALRNLNLAVRAGERISVVGENGAGKSTLLGSLLGILQGTGDFCFEGEVVTRRRCRQLWRKVGLVFQNCADQLFCPSVKAEVAFGPRQLGYSAQEVGRRVKEALGRVHLSGFEERVPLHLSGGERKRLALACVLAMSPEILILDEPTAGLDPQGEELLLEILKEIDQTLILVSHDMFFVGELTERTLVMHEGTIVQEMATADFLQNSELSSLNGLDFTYRNRCSVKIRDLQHQHEHRHTHHHLHDHPHYHGDLLHSHPHEHVHDHPHSFTHTHDETGKHSHPSTETVHQHEHPGHEHEPHEHEHKE